MGNDASTQSKSAFDAELRSPEARRWRTADRLHTAAIHLLRRLRRTDEATGLSAARLSALSVLVYSGAMPITQLAAEEQVRPPTMTRLVQALERAGLVRRGRHPDDGRVVSVEATDDGRALLESARRRRLEPLSVDLARYGDGELDLLDRALVLVEELASAPSAGPA